MDADIAEATKKQRLERDANRYVEEYTQDDLDTEIKRTKKDMSAKELDHFEKLWPYLERKAKAMAREGEINVQALENIAQGFGLEASRLSPLLSILLRLLQGK